ncbi:hypothetical protein FAGAP_13308 [Fusarium agapanthi]|uniref:Uncharacterized protein n=1 Tax=Fusarium agapanthi TaxID=1803897 RepID=A0A9P5AWG0_9HYPO|nr:hypothetical protein FAGAP_13308 [Fusarium agapanthi]
MRISSAQAESYYAQNTIFFYQRRVTNHLYYPVTYSGQVSPPRWYHIAQLGELYYPFPPNTKHDEKHMAPSTNPRKSVRSYPLLIRAELAASTFLQTNRLPFLKSLPPLHPTHNYPAYKITAVAFPPPSLPTSYLTVGDPQTQPGTVPSSRCHLSMHAAGEPQPPRTFLASGDSSSGTDFLGAEIFRSHLLVRKSRGGGLYGRTSSTILSRVLAPKHLGRELRDEIIGSTDGNLTPTQVLAKMVELGRVEVDQHRV